MKNPNKLPAKAGFLGVSRIFEASGRRPWGLGIRFFFFFLGFFGLGFRGSGFRGSGFRV